MNTESAEPTTQSGENAPTNPTAAEAAKFAAAIGLSGPTADGGSKWSLRRKARPDTSGRPLVTAETADAAAASIALGASFDAGVSDATTQNAAVRNAAVHNAAVQNDKALIDEATGPIPTVAPSPNPGVSPSPNPAFAPPASSAEAAAAPQPKAAPVQQRPVVGVSPPPAEESSPLAWWRRRRMRVRRVRRTIRHIDPWSVFKVSLILFACIYVAAMAAGVLLWNAAVESGIVERFQSFVEDVGVFETFVIEGDTIFRAASIIGVVMVAAGAALSVVLAILFNLISDLTGGVRVTILEEDLGRPARR